MLGKSRPSLDVLRPEGETVAYVYSGYNGEVLLSQPIQLLWHGMSIGPRRLQILPRTLQVFPDDYTSVQRIWFRLARVWWKLRRWRH